MKRLFIVALFFLAVCLLVIALNMRGSGPWG